ncbi:hypothetical protein A1D24_09775 [Testudinibacter aquarius]|uniref:DeoR family transcriptional regulator n=2 Tax=Testudinibacter aquarius TaxID=1524974 RepID=A0A4R3YA67_9PAST|nr:hypothetical protein A1D24_09775 [Testudinibacter aquarius]TCV88887.1 ribokinase [Testudinibacter aquarius]TNG89493.1 DeoR family transcriptional regulator [Testudinibacter aquarius]
MFILCVKTATMPHYFFFKFSIVSTMKNLTQNERQLFILKLLTETDGVLLTEHLAQKFSVTGKTIRQDITKLQQQGLLNRVRGGIEKKCDMNLDFTEIQSQFFREFDKNLANIYVAHVQKNLFTKSNVLIFGSFNIDIALKIVDFPKLGETILSRESNYMIGGKGMNQALAMVANESAVTFVGKIGQDQFYQYIRKYLNSNKLIKDIIFESTESPTGLAIVLVREDGEKEIIVNNGANKKFTLEEIYSIEEEIQQAEFISLQMENNLEATLAIIQIAKKYRRKIVLDPTPFVPEILDILPNIYLLTPNRTEAEQITSIEIKDTESAKRAIEILHIMGVQNVVLTLAEQGAMVSDGKQIKTINGYKAVINDKSGVGDGFNGALLARLVGGDDVFTASDYACAYAALCIERFGASNMPKGHLVQLKFQQAKGIHL